MWANLVQPGRPRIQCNAAHAPCMLGDCARAHTHTHTHTLSLSLSLSVCLSECVMRFASVRQQRCRELASLLSYTYIAFLVAEARYIAEIR